ncbi:MAG: general secretion pathway protein GspB [Mariprofundaceae bacterium]|nr:general secretion pathway protein GspB [Mariprofundaceae bacterium]
MSYILDALKKSDHERTAHQAAKPVLARPPNTRSNQGVMITFSLTALTIFLLLIGWNFHIPEEKERNHGLATKQHFQQTSIEDNVKNTAAIAQPVPVIPTAPTILLQVQRVQASQEAQKSPPSHAKVSPIAKASSPAPLTTEKKNQAIILPFSALPEGIRHALLDLRLEGHFYDHKKQSGMIVVHGEIYHPSDWINDDLYLLSITEKGAIFEYQGNHRFQMSKFR